MDRKGLFQVLQGLSCARNTKDQCAGESCFGELVKKRLHDHGFSDILQLMSVGSTAVAIDGDSSEPGAMHRRPTTHIELASFVRDFDLSPFGISVGDVVSVVMPNGPDLAVAVLAVMARAVCAPVNASNTIDEIRNELLDVGAKAIIILDSESKESFLAMARDMSITALVATPGDTFGIFHMRAAVQTFEENSSISLWRAPSNTSQLSRYGSLEDQPPDNKLRLSQSLQRSTSAIMSVLGHAGDQSSTPKGTIEEDNNDNLNSPTDTALMLRTSGSSGLPKLVPITLEDLVVAACCTAAVEELNPDDTGINVMPMFHMGGIHRNLLAPILAGGSVVYMSFFEPRRFWELFGEKKCSWYHGVPSIHSSIVDALLPLESRDLEGPDRVRRARQAFVAKGHKIRFVSNAGAALPHAQALELQEIYDTAVLPCYGMSECAAVASPGLRYRLEKPGSVGQVMAARLLVCDGAGQPLGPNEVGELRLTGCPTFSGYIDRDTGSIAPREGAFSTGDMGYVDEDGFLFLTGRSKEVINRGGEIISPLEVEEVFLSHSSIAKAAAFSVRHKQLQEAVGIMVVIEPGHQRPSKSQLVEYASEYLGPPKWPVAVVYSERLPVSSAKKLVRIAMAERLGLPEFSNDTPDTSAHFETTSIPDPALGNKAPVPSRLVKLDVRLVEKMAQALVPSSCTAFAVVAEVGPKMKQALVLYVSNSAGVVNTDAVLDNLKARLPGYMYPVTCVGLKGDLPRLSGSSGEVDLSALPKVSGLDYVPPSNKIEVAIQEMWAEVLGYISSGEPIGVATDFFSLGGTSVQAGAIGFLIRDKFFVPANGALIYEHRTIRELAEFVMVRRGPDAGDEPADASTSYPYFDSITSPGVLASSTSPLVVIVQAAIFASIPLLTVFMMWSFLGTFFIIAKSCTESYIERLFGILMAIFLSRLVMSIWLPFLTLAVKWVVVGRFRPSRQPLWGVDYLRWWVVDQARRSFGMGIFDLTPETRSLFYRLMGARIGKNVVISSNAVITEPDLVTLGDGVKVDADAHLRPAAADCGDLLLAPIALAAGCCLGRKTTVAPGTALPENTCLRPCSSSWDADAANESYRGLCNPKGSSSPPWWPLAPVGIVLAALPSAVGFIPVVLMLALKIDILNGFDGLQGYQGVLSWIISSQWLMLYISGKLLLAMVSPFLTLFTTIAIKRLLFPHSFYPGPHPSPKSWDALGRWWVSQVLPDGLLCGVAPLINVHSEMHSMILRLLGAKVGKHIYWPLSGLCTSMHDLVEIGDDVVWGAHHTIQVSDAEGLSPVRVLAGANPLDRCYLGPGSSLGVNCLVGTGSYVGKDQAVKDGAVYLGSTILETSDERASADTLKPYGRAHGLGLAKVRVVPDLAWPLILAPLAGLRSVWQRVPFMSALWAMDACLGGALQRQVQPMWLVLLLIAGIFVIISAIHRLLSVGIDVWAKWAIIGRRTAGPHHFDKSSYSQLWHFYLSFQPFSKAVLEQWTGTAMLSAYFRALGGSVGSDVCWFEGPGPMLTREADLTAIGSRVCINNSIIRCHSNAHGLFDLQPITIGSNVTLRSQSVIQGGASVGNGAVLLERTLAMPGESVKEGTAMQGWPADIQVPARAFASNYAAEDVESSEDSAMGADMIVSINVLTDGIKVGKEVEDDSNTLIKAKDNALRQKSALPKKKRRAGLRMLKKNNAVHVIDMDLLDTTAHQQPIGREQWEFFRGAWHLRKLP